MFLQTLRAQFPTSRDNFRDLFYDRFMNQSKVIEPQLLAMFRLFVGLILGFAFVGSALIYFVLGIPLFSIQILSLIIWVIMFVYLSLPRLHQMLGRFYLPIALVIASTTPIFTQRITQNLFLAEGRMAAFLAEQQFINPENEAVLHSGDAWIVFLFIPLVFIAWQYDFRSVLFFAAGTALLDIALALQLLGAENERVVVMFNTISTRSIAFILIGFIIVRLVARQRQQQNELAEANQQLTNYAGMLEEFTLNLEQLTMSRERNRLARELHDTLAHTLSAMSVQLEAVNTLWDTKPDQAHELLQNSLVTTRSGLTETRRALQALRASPLDDLGLALAIRNLADSAAERAGFSVQVDISQTIDNLNAQVEQTVYRVVQESLENVTRHAAAKQVTLTLKRQNGTIMAEIVDDGMGFDPGDVNQRDQLGLRGMRERVTMLNGSLEVQSVPDQGTTVRLVMNEVSQ